VNVVARGFKCSKDDDDHGTKFRETRYVRTLADTLCLCLHLRVSLHQGRHSSQPVSTRLGYHDDYTLLNCLKARWRSPELSMQMACLHAWTSGDEEGCPQQKVARSEKVARSPHRSCPFSPGVLKSKQKAFHRINVGGGGKYSGAVA